jgi:YaiO family outer membrane protein
VASLHLRSTSPAASEAGGARRCGQQFAALLVALVLLSTGGPAVALAQGPADSVLALRSRAEALRGERRLDDARDIYRVLVDRDPHDFEYRFWLAKLEGWTGHLPTAESLFVALLEERPEDYDSRIGLSDVRLWLGRYNAAAADLEALQRTHPDDAEVLYRLGRVREAKGDPRGARRDFERALRADPGHAEARAALQRVGLASRWEMGVEYYGDRLSGIAASNGGSASLEARPNDALRWRAAATVQQKFSQTEARVGGELAHRLFRSLELRWSAYVAPGAEVLPRQTYGLGLARRLGGGLVLYADYTFLDFADADVHRISPRLELYAGPHWVLSGRYGYSRAGFKGVANAVGNHAGSVSLGYVYGGSNLLQVLAAAGGESFALPSRDAIGGFSAHTVGLGWRHFVTPWLGLALFYSHQDRSDGAKQDSYGLGLVRRW